MFTASSETAGRELCSHLNVGKHCIARSPFCLSKSSLCMQHAAQSENVSFYDRENLPCFLSYSSLSDKIKVPSQAGVLEDKHALSYFLQTLNRNKSTQIQSVWLGKQVNPTHMGTILLPYKRVLQYHRKEYNKGLFIRSKLIESVVIHSPLCAWETRAKFRSILHLYL